MANKKHLSTAGLKPSGRIAEISFILLFLITAYFTWLIFEPFINVIFLALISAIMLSPVYKWIDKSFSLPYWLNMLLTFLFTFILVMLPIVIILRIAVGQIDQFRSQVDVDLMIATIEKLRDAINNYNVDADTLLPADVAKVVHNLLSTAAEVIRNSLAVIVKASATALTNFMVFIIVTFSLLPVLDKLGDYVYKISPLGDKLTDLYLTQSKAITMNIIKGSFIVAAVQAVLAGLALWVVGVPFVFFLTIIMFFLSLVPLLSSYFITVPVSLYLLVTGDTLAAIGLMLWQVFVVSTIDNVLRPYLASKEVKLQMALLLLGILGGIMAFGMMGLIYGPLIIILFITSLEVYRHTYGEKIK